MSTRKIKLGAFIQATGHHIAAWRHPGSQADSGTNIDHYQEVAQLAERGLFDLAFLADSPGGWDNESPARGRQGRLAVFEPVTLWAALAARTTHLGFVATASTTYEEPYTLARKFASLDHISKGRAAWNVVTTGSEQVAGNFGLDKHPEHDLRYERAEEFVDVVKGLWDSYDDDAFLRDKASGIYFDVEKQHTLNHKGRFFTVRGPLNISRTPQGHPVVIQAGASEPGRDLAARTAEVIFTAWQTLEEAQAFYRDMKGRLAAYGRGPEDLLVMPGISPIIGRTKEEAEAKQRELDDLIHPDIGYQILQRYFPGVDLRTLDLDGPTPEFNASTNGNQSRLSLVTRLARRDNLTLRQLYQKLAGARGHRVVVGTPETIADEIQSWFENEVADGFNIMPPVLPESLRAFVDLVVPVLQKRGIYRTAYTGKTLRENLGLKRPKSRYAYEDAKPQREAAAV